MLTLDKIYQASYALKTVIRRTDLISAPNINPESHIFLKPENLQVTGSFKVRGACFKIAQLTEEEKSHGVVACSAGNHAQGVALAATAHGIKSLICLPDNAPISKVEATKSYGADVCLVEGVYDDAYNKALQLKDEKGYTFIHPFDDDLRSRLCHQELEPGYQSLRSASQRSAQHVKLYRAWENRTPRRCTYHSRRYRRKRTGNTYFRSLPAICGRDRIRDRR